MALDTGILAGMTALTKISCPGLVGSQTFEYYYYLYANKTGSLKGYFFNKR